MHFPKPLQENKSAITMHPVTIESTLVIIPSYTELHWFRDGGTVGQRVNYQLKSFQSELHWCTKPGFWTQPRYEAPDDLR